MMQRRIRYQVIRAVLALALFAGVAPVWAGGFRHSAPFCPARGCHGGVYGCGIPCCQPVYYPCFYYPPPALSVGAPNYAGHFYDYDVRATYQVNGKEVSTVRLLRLRAGDRLEALLSLPTPSGPTAASKTR